MSDEVQTEPQQAEPPSKYVEVSDEELATPTSRARDAVGIRRRAKRQRGVRIWQGSFPAMVKAINEHMAYLHLHEPRSVDSITMTIREEKVFRVERRETITLYVGDDGSII